MAVAGMTRTVGLPPELRGQNGDAYDENTRVSTNYNLASITATDCTSIDTVLRVELAKGEGTPEWRAWVLRAAARHGVITPIIEEAA